MDEIQARLDNLENKIIEQMIFEATESFNKDSARSYLVTIYQHLIKWFYQPEKQSTSWINSIRDNINEFLYYYSRTDTFKYIRIIEGITQNDQQECYIKAINNAYKEMSREKNISIRDIDHNLPQELCLSNIMNKRFVKQWMLDRLNRNSPYVNSIMDYFRYKWEKEKERK